MAQFHVSPSGLLNRLLRVVGMFALGLIVGGFFHYLLFRLGLPVKPFIYAAF